MSAQKKKTLIIVCAAVVLVAAMLAVWFAFGPKGTAGQKAIGVTVVTVIQRFILRPVVWR